MKDLLESLTQSSKDSLQDILEAKIASFPKPKKTVGWYCLGSKSRAYCVSFATYSKPNFIKRFFMRTLLDFYWIKETQQ